MLSRANRGRCAWLVLAVLIGCGAETAEPDEAAIAAQAVTLVRCGNQLTQCSMRASDMGALGACSEVFDACSAEAAADLRAAEDLLVDCRDEADACLRDAETMSEVRACRDLFNRCAVTTFEECAAMPEPTVPRASEGAVQATALLATAQIRALHEVPEPAALDLLELCRSTALDEIAAVQKPSGSLVAVHVFEQCALDALQLAIVAEPR